MEHDNYRITGFGAISQEDARELERQQAELLKDELKSLSSSDDKQRISAIKERLKAIQKLAENYYLECGPVFLERGFSKF